MLDTYGRKYIQPLLDWTAKKCIAANITATQVTWIAFVVGVSSGVLIYLDHIYAAVLILWFSGFLDALDGTIARQTQQSTSWGTLLDISFDRLVELSVIMGLALRYPEMQIWLLLLTASIVLAMTVFLTVGALTEKRGMKSFYYQAGLAERTEGFILFTVMMLFPQWLLWSTLFFIGVEWFTTGQRLHEAKKILK
ncbi:CDP-alcohol phosphatidyltransferase family protein [Hazenella sp. IB182357]|uniref:CDP-alcohol phosphatidyltransferase family protein n=1 Tax=Polycladospora coralii TaxID=2771432 RepID=A0A926N8C4_9BACL|nr:CDP-alcohol phosphatidyltransferase family protein [Polycladospora coralii]MBD1373916.1 CDP-alcohol phosphatidyltransferase family protein [Polycladospora coralii]MBS7531038.1 CDP-alcohol phosphatidyltransferase family protein [Polycladospora coralii]